MTSKQVLYKLSKTLKNNNITWGIGGSYLLYLHGLYDNPEDIDLWINPEDIKTVRTIFREFEEIDTEIPLPKELHFKMLYYEVEVDFVACFMTKPNQYDFMYTIDANNIEEISIGKNKTVPCTYLEEWYIVYKLLHREDKAKIIESYFNKHEIKLSDKIHRIRDTVDRALKNPSNKVPQKVIEDAYSLVHSSLQISLFDE